VPLSKEGDESAMSQEIKFEDTDEVWDEGELGRDEEFAEVAEIIDEQLIDDSLDLQLISIRLQKSLIEDFKVIAKIHGIGYQPLMRQILKRFADCEKKKLIREYASSMQKEEEEALLAEVARKNEKEAC